MTTSNESSVNEGIMSKIMKLLERANHPETPAHEAKLAEEMAEKLMSKHMIDRFEAEQRSKARGEMQRRPVQDECEVRMDAHKAPEGVDYTSMSEFDSHVITMMQYVLKHCNVKVHPHHKFVKVVVNSGTKHERLTEDRSRRLYTIVGFPEDIAYAERIWFNVFRTFVANVNPQWDPKEALEWNAYNFASAGVSWKQQVLIAEKANDDRIEKPWRYQSEDRKAPFYSSFQAGALIDPGNEAWGRSIHRLKRACKKYADTKGVAYPYAGGAKLRVASRNSFARSYKATIIDRLDDLRQRAQEGDDHVDSGKFALAIQDTEERVTAEFYRLFPEYDPEVRRKMRESEEFERACAFAALSEDEQAEAIRIEEESRAASDRIWAASSRRARRNYGRVRQDPADNYDAAAWARGRSAAHTVNLRNDGEVHHKERKGIE